MTAVPQSSSGSGSRPHPVARTPAEWEAVFGRMGERPFRAKQVFEWIHRRGVMSPHAMTNLPKSLRESLAEEGLASPVRVDAVRRSQDDTRKLLIALERGGMIECVLIPMTDAPEDDDADDPPEMRRVTLCISTQVGCAMGCRFCASGRAGLKRALGADEIVAQVLVAREHLDPGENLRNIVFMGMGEPLHHYDETARSIRLLTDPAGGGMSPRRITVSTVGLVPKIAQLGDDFHGKIGLAVSLHAPDDRVRSAIMPMNDHYPVKALVDALRKYPLPSRRRITIEYTLIDGVNDRIDHAKSLARLLAGLPVKINLIPMNPVAGSEYRKPSSKAVVTFRETLANAGYSCFVRRTRGDDVDAACGQLALADSLVRT